MKPCYMYTSTCTCNMYLYTCAYVMLQESDTPQHQQSSLVDLQIKKEFSFYNFQLIVLSLLNLHVHMYNTGSFSTLDTTVRGCFGIYLGGFVHVCLVIALKQCIIWTINNIHMYMYNTVSNAQRELIVQFCMNNQTGTFRIE